MEFPTKNVYTDGGCYRAGSIGAWAYALEEKPRVYSISRVEAVVDTTNQRMEMLAVIMALEELPPGAYRIISDSQYTIKGITSWILNWKKNSWRTYDLKPVKNKDLWLRMEEAKSKHKLVHFKHVRGHAGVHGNEHCDALCSAAMWALKNLPPKIAG